MTTSELLDLINPEVGNVHTHRTYRNSRDIKVMLIDMYYQDEIPLLISFIEKNAPSLKIDVITATPFGSPPRRRIVITGFTN